MNTCYIIGAGDVFTVDFCADETDFVICADGGYEHRALLKKQPDIVMGDFDSLGFVPDGCERLVFPSKKDESDMLLCVDKGFEKGCKSFVILGGLGGERMDHSVANIQLLKYIAQKGSIGFLLHEKNIFTCVHNGTVEFSSSAKGYISVFSLSDESHGVTIRNLAYETDNVTVTDSVSVGLSNEFIGKKSSISVKQGSILICWKGKLSDCLNI